MASDVVEAVARELHDKAETDRLKLKRNLQGLAPETAYAIGMLTGFAEGRKFETQLKQEALGE